MRKISSLFLVLFLLTFIGCEEALLDPFDKRNRTITNAAEGERVNQTLIVTKLPNSPDATIVEVAGNGVTTNDVGMITFRIEALHSDHRLRTLPISITDSVIGTGGSFALARNYDLLVDGQHIASRQYHPSFITDPDKVIFDLWDENLVVPAGGYRDFSILVDIGTFDQSTVVNGSTLALSIIGSEIEAYVVPGNPVIVDIMNLPTVNATGRAIGSTMDFRTQWLAIEQFGAPGLEVLVEEIAYPNTVSMSITFAVAARNQDYYIPARCTLEYSPWLAPTTGSGHSFVIDYPIYDPIFLGSELVAQPSTIQVGNYYKIESNAPPQYLTLMVVFRLQYGSSGLYRLRSLFQEYALDEFGNGTQFLDVSNLSTGYWPLYGGE